MGIEEKDLKDAVRESLERYYKGEVTDEMVHTALPMFISGVRYGVRLARGAVHEGMADVRAAMLTRAPKPESDEVLDAEIVG